MAALFTERQRFTQVWLWVVLACINAIWVIGLVKQVLMGHPYGDKPMSNTALICTGIGVLALSCSFLYLRLDTEISEAGISYRFFPFQRRMRTIGWSDVTQIYVRKYRPLIEYGGWGIRSSFSGKGNAFNVSGNEGIQIVLRNGNLVLLGTNMPEEAEEALRKIRLIHHGLLQKP